MLDTDHTAPDDSSADTSADTSADSPGKSPDSSPASGPGNEHNTALLNAITRIIPSLLTAMEAFENIQANLDPRRIGGLGSVIGPFEDQLQADLALFRAVDFPPDIQPIGDTISQAATYAWRACNGLSQAGDDFGLVMRALRAHCRAQEIIYTLAPAMTPVNQYFLEPWARGNGNLLAQLASSDQHRPGGILSAVNERSERGGFSLYIPENLPREQPAAVVFALHGGAGHGADFIWSWLREARSRGFILVAPTSQSDTWSLQGEDRDLPALLAILDYLRKQWLIDSQHILLAGMSDGATYCLQAGLNANSPFTHLAPFSGVLHPDIVMQGRMQYANAKPIYLVHGSHDWMFPIEVAQMARAELEQANANLTYREIAGLSHHFARTELPAVLTWFQPTLGEPHK